MNLGELRKAYMAERPLHSNGGSKLEPGFRVQGRLRLLFYLIIQPRTPTELASLENKHLSDVSRKLRKLKDMGLVESTPSGSRERYYRVTRDGFRYYNVLVRQVQ